MGRRIKIYGSFAILGWLVGAMANVAYFWAWPILVKIYPQILEIFENGWILWGFVGALISVAGCMIYASLPKK
jgi:hypothetical protein